MASVLSGVKRTFSTASADWDGRASGTERDSRRASPRQHLLAPDGSADRPRRATVEVVHTQDKRLSSTASSQPEWLPFDSDASVVLAGVRGAGKSTLAVIASTAMRRKIVEADKVFQDTHGLSGAVYQREHGVPAYRRAQSEVLQHVLEKHRRGAIIVCSWMERDVQARLSQCASTNPIILILRDPAAIQTHLRVWDDAKVQDLMTASGPVFRRCTRFEFFNISETPAQLSLAAADGSTADDRPVLDPRSPAPYLTLKRAERHFLKFLSLILPPGTIPFFESAYPLASLPTEDRKFTYALSIRLSAFADRDIDVEEIEPGADAIELIVDTVPSNSGSPSGYARPLSPQLADHISRVVSHIRRSTVIPIIYHVVLPDPDNQSDSKRASYLAHVLHGLRLAPDYFTVDLRLPEADIARIRAAAWTSRAIGNVNIDTGLLPSWHDPIWLSYYRRAVELGCHAVRLTKQAVDLKDNFEISQFIHSAKMAGSTAQLPLIAYNTGPHGRFSACFNQVLTSVAAEKPPSQVPAPTETDEASDDGGDASESSLTARQATAALYSSFVYEPLRLYVFGANVDYSVSPAMHNTALSACGIPHTYRPNSTDSMEHIRALIHDPKFGGASIGLPFKVEAIRLTRALSSHAKAVGAINTLIPVRQLNADGSMPDYGQILNSRNQSGPVLAIYGENTDWIGIRACIRRGLSPANAVRQGSVGLVIGAGGMARAAVYAMLQLGVKQIVIFNRTIANAEKMVSHFAGMLERDEMQLLGASSDVDVKTQFHVLRTRHDPWPDSCRLPTMIISCIPTHSIGANPAPNFTLSPAWFGSPTGGVLVEFAYKTLRTPLLDQTRPLARQGWVSMDGLDLLPEQGFAQFELFTGRRAPRRLMRQEVFKAHKDDQGRSNLERLRTRMDNIVNQEP